MQKWFRHWTNRAVSCSGCSKRSTQTSRSASGAADIDRMENLACPRPRPAMRVPRNDRPCHRCGRGCLLTPPTDRTPPVDTLPPVVSNVRFANSLLEFLSNRRELALGADAGCSLRNKRPDLSGRPPCKGMAIGVARRGARRSGERTLRIPPSCSDPVSHAGGPHVASFVVGRPCARVRACVQAWRNVLAGAGVLAWGHRAMRCKQEGRTASRKESGNPKQGKGTVRVL